MKLKLIMVFVSFNLGYSGFSQLVDWNKVESSGRRNIRPFENFSPTQVLLLGSFHFNYPNLDDHKIDSSKMINVLSEQRQAEIRQLIDVINLFKPTRIYIEVSNIYQKWVDSMYNAYNQGKYKLGRNEIYQIGFRLAKENGDKKLYSVDDDNFVRDNYEKYPWIDSLWKNSPPVDSVRDHQWDMAYKNYFSEDDNMTINNSVLETFLIHSDRRTLNLYHGSYLTHGFSSANDKKGPDRLAMWWYSRNLRIYNNILKTNPGPDDRIIVLFGFGHMSILTHLFESSPEFKLVSLKDLANKFEETIKDHGNDK